jgi:hypothetical protein
VSSYSQGGANNCVEVAHAPVGLTGFWDTKFRQAGPVVVSDEAGRAFIRAAASGRFTA